MYRKLFRKLMLVQVLSILTTTVAVIADSSVTSMFLGEAALSAAGLAMPLVLFFATIGGAVAVGFQTVVARKLGQGDREGASSAFNYILILTLVISIIGAVLTFLFADQLAVLLGTTRGNYEHVQVMGYLRGYSFGIPAYSVMLLLSPVMFIDSDKNRITASILVMVAVDVALDMLNVLYFKREMFGMAAASSVSYIAAAAVLLLHFRRKGNVILLDLKSARPIELRAVFKNSSTYTVYHICKSALTYAINILLIWHCLFEEVAVYAALSALALALTSAGSAMGSVTLFFASLFHGDNDAGRKLQLKKIFVRYSLIICGAFTVVTVVFAPYISGLFILDDSPQFDSCVTGLRLLALSLILNSVNNCCRNYFQGVGRLASSLTVCILQYFAAPAGALFFILLIGANRSIWLFYIIGEAVAFIAAMIFNGKEKRCDLLDREILVEDAGSYEAAAGMIRQTLTDNGIADGKMQLVNKVMKEVSDLCADADQQKAELNIRAYETGGELRCSVETDLTDPEGIIEQMAHQDENRISFSEVFGLKRIVMEDLRNE